MTVKTTYHKYKRTEGTSLTGGNEMGLVFAEIELINYDDLAFQRRGWVAEAELHRVTTRALVDSGAMDLVITDPLREKLIVNPFSPDKGSSQIKRVA